MNLASRLQNRFNGITPTPAQSLIKFNPHTSEDDKSSSTLTNNKNPKDMSQTKTNLLSQEEKKLNSQIESLSLEFENIQSMLNDDTITKLWNHFRECENKKNGRIPKKEFKNCVENVFNESYNYIVLAKDKKKLIIDLLFERFNYIPGLNSIDIYDFLISLSVLSRISNDEKIELILKLIDVDEDRCLSISKF